MALWLRHYLTAGARRDFSDLAPRWDGGRAWNTAVVPHVWGTGIGLAASLQFMATLPPTPLSANPEEPMLEYDTSSHPLRQDLVGGAIRMSDGKVAVSQHPGIGVEVDREVLGRYGRRIF